jgi:hypothetical protein
MLEQIPPSNPTKSTGTAVIWLLSLFHPSREELAVTKTKGLDAEDDTGDPRDIGSTTRKSEPPQLKTWPETQAHNVPKVAKEKFSGVWSRDAKN